MPARQLHKTPTEISQALAMTPAKRSLASNRKRRGKIISDADAWLCEAAERRPTKGLLTAANKIKARQRPHR